ncbi:hypothetical protein PRZ48_009719 [Zasmidium cellare]|uniref:Uncharacterized protein n=1 Tax=Zasmidium cellare TaxID=395010 RepID=A0ABR0ED70_ZASCE|nr:hypothetical protein PRZ48_009719 [Zasmidium cellare]
MRFETLFTPLLGFAATAVSVAINKDVQLDARQEQDVCAGTDFATVYEVRVCEPYDVDTCSAIAATIQDCSNDRSLYWICEDDGSGAYNGTGGYYARVDMTPDTTDMECVDKYLLELFSNTTDIQIVTTDCSLDVMAPNRERRAVEVIDDKQ